MGIAYNSVKNAISNNRHSPKQEFDEPYRKKKMYIVCQYWKELMRLNGLTLSLIDIIVKYAYIKYEPKLSGGNDYDYMYKLLLVGPESGGKSSILLRYCDDYFAHNIYISTIGVDFKMRTIHYDNTMLVLQIWDTAGKERFRQITRSYYRGAKGICIVFDITSRESYDALNEQWRLDLSNYSNVQSVIILVGAKCDLVKDRKVSVEEATQFAKSMGYVEYIEVSAKDGTNIEYCFKQMIKYIRERARLNFDENKPFLYPCT